MSQLYEDYIKTYIGLNQNNSDGFFDVVGDIYYSEEVQSLAQYEQHLEIDRLQHITGVAFIAYKLSKKLGLDYKAAARAATMHDLVYYDWRNGETGGWHKNHGYKHPKYACYNAKELCGNISDIEYDAILRHMWPLTLVPPKYKESFIVTFSDKYCAAREVLYSVSHRYKSKFLSDVEVRKSCKK
ncbi:MAG: HD domain-containing protein [Clostridia bacterium]|nr:HD domain-containing protein [Clostridia bacterium]